MEQMMVIAPIDAQVNKTGDIADNNGPQLFQCMPAGIMWYF